MVFCFLFSVFCWQSILFDKFVIQAGADFSGVATDLATMNATVKFVFRNTATFFGVHVTSTPLQLSYSQLTLASGTVCNPYPKTLSLICTAQACEPFHSIHFFVSLVDESDKGTLPCF